MLLGQFRFSWKDRSEETGVAQAGLEWPCTSTPASACPLSLSHTGAREPGAGELGAAQGDREAEGGAATPERGAEGAREDVPAADVPYELCAASAGPGGQLSATMTHTPACSSLVRLGTLVCTLGSSPYTPVSKGYM